MGQKYAGYDQDHYVTGFYDSADSPPPSMENVIALTDAQWQAAIGLGGRLQVSGGDIIRVPDVINLDDVKATVKQAIRDKRDALLLLTPFNGKVFQTDIASKIQIMVLASQSALLPSAAQWRTYDNTYMTMTLALFQQLMAAIMTREGVAYGNSSKLQDQVDALTTVAAVQAFDITTGWPA